MIRTGLLLAWAAGCGGAPSEALTFATYNAGLAEGFVPGAASRTPLAAEAIAAIDADVLCLQEVWTPDQVTAVDDAAAATFPHRFFPDADQSTDATCGATDLDGLLTCTADSCGEACTDELVDCIFDQCGTSFLSLPTPCMRCAMANVGVDPQEIADTCVDDPIEFAYGGSYGTGLLSRFPLLDVTVETFESTSNRRGVIHAVVDAPPEHGGPVDVYCTHLTAVFDTIPYPRDAGGWAEEQLVQVDALNALTEAGGDRRVILGDLNTGPGLEGIRAEAPDSYSALKDAGWDVPYVGLDGRCTFCSENPLIAGPDDDDDRLIDHVMLKGFAGATSATRIVDGEVSADSCAVDLSVAAVSDHYGVSVTVQADP